MLRTRDYFLLLVVIVFLLVAIGTTVITDFWSPDNSPESALTFVDNNEAEFSATAPDDVDSARKDKLLSLREKIRAGADLSMYQDNTVEEEIVIEEEVSSEDSEIISELRCPAYSVAVVAWNTTGIKIEEIEGLRLVYRDVVSAPVDASASTTVVTQSKDILLKLPVRMISQGGKNCIPKSVIGITIGGSLIKNTDTTLYTPFAEGTILGYALDGYPIYGTSAAPTDSCGGRTVNGQYRYQLSSERDTVLNCYSGLPVQI